MAPILEIQVLTKQDYIQLHPVPLPNAYPLPTLAPDSIRIQSTLFSLSNNNFGYARLGHIFCWWNFHPSHPPPRPKSPILLTSTHRLLGLRHRPLQHRLFPSPRHKSLRLLANRDPAAGQARQPHPEIENQVFERSPHRRTPAIMPTYNRYMTMPLSASPSKESIGYDAIDADPRRDELSP